MVNSKDFAQDYKSYYRPSLDDDDKTFFPKQGTLPLYFFKNGIYQPQDDQPTYQLFLEELNIEEKDQLTSNYYLYFSFFILFILIIIIKRIRMGKWENPYKILERFYKFFSN